MKSITKTIASALLIVAVSGNALADRGWQQQRYSNHHHQQRSDHADWVGPLVLLGLGAVALSALADQSEPPRQQPVYVAEQRAYPPSPPPSAGYFCRSVGQYYPYTRHCPEGWLLVQ